MPTPKATADHFAENARYDPEAVDKPIGERASRAEILWCGHCERAYPAGWYRPVKQGGGTLHLCPYSGCGGDVVMDVQPYSRWVEAHGYPSVPTYGEFYPRFGRT